MEIGFNTIIDWRIFTLESFGLDSAHCLPFLNNAILTDDKYLLMADLLKTYPQLDVIFVVDAFKNTVATLANGHMYSRKIDDWKDVGMFFRLVNAKKFLLLCYDGAAPYNSSIYYVQKH